MTTDGLIDAVFISFDRSLNNPEQREFLRSLFILETERLRGMVAYALDAPDDPEAIRKILRDALAGKNGAE